LNDVRAEARGPHSDADAWSIQDAKSTYLIDRWGAGYFDVNEEGDLTIAPARIRGRKVALKAGRRGRRRAGHVGSALVSLPGSAPSPGPRLNVAFNSAIQENKYRGE